MVARRAGAPCRRGRWDTHGLAVPGPQRRATDDACRSAALCPGSVRISWVGFRYYNCGAVVTVTVTVALAILERSAAAWEGGAAACRSESGRECLDASCAYRRNTAAHRKEKLSRFLDVESIGDGLRGLSARSSRAANKIPGGLHVWSIQSGKTACQYWQLLQ
jgi:hypothetical protein